LYKNKNTSVGVSATTFAEFNQDLYYNNELPVDQFQLPEDLNNAKITTAEVKNVLESHFKANKSTGLSQLPLQCLKWVDETAHSAIADFLNKSAIEQLAPQTWRDSKVVPLYKGEG
jgi:hypothetical protein